MSVVPFALSGGGELLDLAAMQQQLPGAQALVVHGVAVREGADVGVEEEGLAVLEQAVGVLEVGLAFADGLDLGAAQGDAALVAVAEEVVEAGRAVEGGVALPGGHGIAVLRLGGGFGGGRGGGRVGERTRHRRRFDASRARRMQRSRSALRATAKDVEQVLTDRVVLRMTSRVATRPMKQGNSGRDDQPS